MIRITHTAVLSALLLVRTALIDHIKVFEFIMNLRETGPRSFLCLWKCPVAGSKPAVYKQLQPFLRKDLGPYKT